MLFKKSRKFVVSLMLASLSPLLVNSPAHANSYFWTDWSKCTFSVIRNSYTPWRARIQTRSDRAVRVVQVEFGNGNDEPIVALEAWDSWITGGRTRNSDSHTESYYPSRYVGNKSERFTTTWISQRMPRFANIQLTRDNNEICSNRIRI
jgi:hypothetical protein